MYKLVNILCLTALKGGYKLTMTLSNTIWPMNCWETTLLQEQTKAK